MDHVYRRACRKPILISAGSRSRRRGKKGKTRFHAIARLFSSCSYSAATHAVLDSRRGILQFRRVSKACPVVELCGYPRVFVTSVRSIDLSCAISRRDEVAKMHMSHASMQRTLGTET